MNIDTLGIPLSKNEYSEILNIFFLNVSFEKSYDQDPSIERFLYDRCVSHGIDDDRAAQLAKHGAGACQRFYPLHRRDVQRLIGLYTVYFTAVDDLGIGFLDDIRTFRRNMVNGVPQRELLQSFAAILPEFDQHYKEFCSDKITTGVINFMGSCAMEFETTGKFHHLPTSTSFPRYFRVMTGLAEPYAYFLLTNDVWSEENMNLFVQAVPDIMDFTDSVNDLLSFYKESILSDERNNYVYHRALGENVQVLDILRRLVDEILRYMKNIRSTVSENANLFQVVDAYLRGYIGFHVMQPRYRLHELGLPTLKESWEPTG